MTAYLSFEWLKLTKRWMPRVILAMVLALIVLAFWGQGTRVEDQPNLILPRGWLSALLFSSFFAPFFWPVLGGSWAGNEYGWGTIRMILTRRPYRMQQVLSALSILLIALAIAMVVVLVVGTIAGFLVGVLTGHSGFVSGVADTSFVGIILKTLAAAWYVGAFYLLLAFAAATVFRSAAVGIGIGIGSTLAEIILRQIFGGLGSVWKEAANHFPVIYTQELAAQVANPGFASGTRATRIDPGTPGIGESVIAIACYMAILLIVTLLAVRNRDVTA